MAESRAAPLLEVRDLHVHFAVYGGLLKVLDGVSLVVHRGEKIGLVGETGCGKTTMMKALLRVLPSSARIPAGEILFEGRDVLSMSRRELSGLRGRGISMIFQDPTAALNPVFSVGEQLEIVITHSAAAAGRPISRRSARAQAEASLQKVALADPERLLRSYPVQLSGGMRQRVCIGMALATGPGLLIADEPGTSLDVTIQDQILRLLQALVNERHASVILITHTLGVVREMTERVYVMYAGTIVETAGTARLFANPSHPYTKGLLQTVPRLTGGGIAAGIPGRIPDYLSPPTGCRFHPRCPFAMEVCRQSKPPLFHIEDGHDVACFLYQTGSRQPTRPLREGAPS
jgi:peptide/nickel transport system ATP-binding protein